MGRSSRQKTLTPISIQGDDDTATTITLEYPRNSKLDWAKNTEAVYKKDQSRLSSEAPVNQYLQYYVRTSDADRINKFIRKAGSALRVELVSLVVSERWMLCKLRSFMDNDFHPLHSVMVMHRSTVSSRLLSKQSTRERHRKSFLSGSQTRLYNSLPHAERVTKEAWGAAVQPPF